MSDSPAKQKRKQRFKLWQEDPRCHWCGIITQWSSKKLIKQISNKTVKQPPNMATLDHLYSRFHPDRKITTPDIKRRFLSCYKCNHARGFFDDQRRPWWVLIRFTPINYLIKNKLHFYRTLLFTKDYDNFPRL